MVGRGGSGFTRGVVVAKGDADVSAAADGEGAGVTVSSGFGTRRNGVAVAAVLAAGSGVCAGRCGVAVAIGAAVAVADGACVAETAGAALASAVACAGFTKTFEGASAGGGASDFIFARVFSTACRSEIPSQPRS